jgi:hypothetical protein
MPTISDNYHDNLIETMKDLANNSRWFASSINLGGVPGSGGGSGGPPGGFYGQLIQAQVAYDTTEALVSGGPVASGWSLVDNLNHIRFNINAKQSPLVIQNEGVTVASGNFNVMNFVGSPVDAVFSGGKVIVNISGTGGGAGSGLIKVSADDTTANYLENKLSQGTKITISTINPGGNEQSQITFAGLALSELSDATIVSPIEANVVSYDNAAGKWKNRTAGQANLASGTHNHIQAQITDLVHDAVKLQTRDIDAAAPTSGHVLAWNSLKWTPSGIDFGNASKLLGRYLDTTVPVSGQVLAWNSLKWIPSGLAAGGTTDTKKVLVLSTDTTEDFLQNKVRPGANITINVISGTGNAFLQIAATVSGAGADTKKVMVSSADTTENYLENKLSAGSNITITKLNPGGNEQLQIASTASGAGGSGGSSTFLGLTDVIPKTYAGSEQRYVRVNAYGTGLEFVPSGTAPPPVVARVHLDTNRPYSADGWQNLNWGVINGQQEDFDTYEAYYRTSGPDYYREAFYCPDTGYYQVRARLTLVSGLESGQVFHFSICQNGSAAYLADGYIYPTSSGFPTSLEIATSVYLNKSTPPGNDSVNVRFERLYTAGRAYTYVVASGYNMSYFELSKLASVYVASGVTGNAPSCCRTYGTGTSGIGSSGVWGSIYWTNETFDTDNYWTVGPTLGYKLIAPTSGWYDVHANIGWQNNPYGMRNIRLMKNNSFELATASAPAVDIGGRPIMTQTSDVVYLLKNDFISVQGMSNAGNQNCQGGDSTLFITIAKLY